MTRFVVYLDWPDGLDEYAADGYPLRAQTLDGAALEAAMTFGGFGECLPQSYRILDQTGRVAFRHPEGRAH